MKGDDTMGCFSVCCGVTRLSITCGDECVFIPLTTKEVYRMRGMNPYDIEKERKHYTEVAATSNLIHNDEIFEPAGFPIFGTYDDYGSIEDIVEDENTKAIENHFGMSIEEFMEMATEGRRSPYDSYSVFCERFFSNPKDLEYGTSVADFLQHLGFNNNTNEKVVVEPGEKEFKVFWKEDGAKQTPKTYDNNDKEQFLDDYLERTGEYLGLKDIELFNELYCIGGMFVLKDVYEFYSQNNDETKGNLKYCEMTPAFAKKNGFVETDEGGIWVCGDIKYDENKETTNGQKTREIKDFVTACKRFGKKIDVSDFKTFDIQDWNKFNYIEHGIDEIKKIRKMSEEINKIKSVDIGTTAGGNVFLKGICKKYLYYLDEYEMLGNIYAEELLKGNLVDDYFNFTRFLRAMYLTNIVFIPTFCGAQCGCRKAEIKLSYITNEIVKKREEERKDDDEEYEELSPFSRFSRYE